MRPRIDGVRQSVAYSTRDTAYSAVVVNKHMYPHPSLYHFFMFLYIGTVIHMIIHYNCTIGIILLHFFLLIYHPYPPVFHEIIFILAPLIFLR